MLLSNRSKDASWGCWQSSFSIAQYIILPLCTVYTCINICTNNTISSSKDIISLGYVMQFHVGVAE